MLFRSKTTLGGTATQCAHCGSARVEPAKRLLPEGLRAFAFHDLRHHFISHAVMSGIDFMTVAAWVGHKDGGVLIGKVYGHLADEHRERMGSQLRFQPEIMALPAVASS